MKLGVVADDFTGASDIALTLAEGGMRVAQFVGIPVGTHRGIEAGVISLKTRTAPASDAVAASVDACDWLVGHGCEQVIYKICSTFDSTDDGNIGPVLEALAQRLGENRIAVCPAFPENGRSVYQGHLFVGDRLLSESGMKHHPLTPMHDADLRRVLARQTTWPVDHMPAEIVFSGRAAIAAAMRGPRAMVIIDAVRNDDLVEIGTALRDRKLLCGGSGIALGLPANFGCVPRKIPWRGADGRGVVLSGSCSDATRAQIKRYCEQAPHIEISAREVMENAVSAAGIADRVMAQPEKAPIVYSSADPAAVKAAQNTYGRETLAQAIETLFADLAHELERRGVTRIVAAGGETSGAVVSGLAADTLDVGPRIAAGVPALRVGNRNLAIALKSGNFGDEDFFMKALDVLAGQA